MKDRSDNPRTMSERSYHGATFRSSFKAPRYTDTDIPNKKIYLVYNYLSLEGQFYNGSKPGNVPLLLAVISAKSPTAIRGK